MRDVEKTCLQQKVNDHHKVGTGKNEQVLAVAILLHPSSLVEFVKCYCLILAMFGEVKTGP